MSQQTAVAIAPEEVTSDPTLGWDGPRADAAGLRRMSQRPGLWAYIGQLWERREFIMQVPLGDLRQQHMNTVLGSSWHLLSPMLMSGVYYLIFGVLLGARRGIDNYAIYLVAGVLTFRFTQKCIQSGAKSIVKNEKMLHNLSFPAAALPLSSVLTETFAQGPALVVLCLFAIVTGEIPRLGWVLLVPIAVLQAFFNFGLASIASRLTVHFRDTEEILQYVLRLGFYLSGVIIGIEAIPSDPKWDWARTVFTLNPAYAYIRLVRGLIYDGIIVTEAFVIALAWTAGLVLVGFVWFWRFEGRYANAV